MRRQSAGRDWEPGNPAGVLVPAVQEGSGHVACQRRASRWLIALALLVLGEVAQAEPTGLPPGKSRRFPPIAESSLAESYGPSLNRGRGFGDWPAILLTVSATIGDSQRQDQSYPMQARRALAQLRFQDAKEAALLAVSQDNRNALAHALLGLAQIGLGDTAGGKEEVDRALHLDRTLALAHVALGAYYWNVASSSEAEQPVSSKSPESVEMLYSKAEREFGTAISLSSVEPSAHDGLGSVYFRRKRYGDAEGEFKKALRIDPEFAAAHFNLGNVFLMKNQWAQAESEYRQAIKLFYQNANFHALLAAALLGQGKRVKAQDEANEARRLGLRTHWVYDELARRQ